MGFECRGTQAWSDTNHRPKHRLIKQPVKHDSEQYWKFKIMKYWCKQKNSSRCSFITRLILFKRLEKKHGKHLCPQTNWEKKASSNANTEKCPSLHYNISARKMPFSVTLPLLSIFFIYLTIKNCHQAPVLLSLWSKYTHMNAKMDS